MRRLRFSSILALLSLVTALFAPLVPTASAASAPSMYFAPTATAAGKGSNFSLALHLNPNGVAINAVNVIVHYPQNQLTLVGVDKGGSYFDTFLPATPAASNGQLNFSAASLASNATSSDVLVATLDFAATADSGSAKVSLDSSQAANNGAPIDVTAGSSQVTFGAAGSGSGTSSIGITGITVSTVSLTGGVVHWKTAVAATSSVDYGADSNYGLTSGSTDLVIDHSIDLGSKFAGKTAIHFRVTSVDAQGNRQSSADQIFTTLGYTVRIQVVNTQSQPQSGVRVSIDGGKASKSDGGGYVTIKNVAGGSQKVTLNGRPQTITVKSLTNPDAATTAQQYKLVAAAGAPVAVYVGIPIVVVVLVVIGILLYRLPTKDTPAAEA